MLTVLDSLERVRQLVQVGGFVASAPGFQGQAAATKPFTSLGRLPCPEDKFPNKDRAFGVARQALVFLSPRCAGNARLPAPNSRRSIA
jgi:hypothetical protein